MESSDDWPGTFLAEIIDFDGSYSLREKKSVLQFHLFDDRNAFIYFYNTVSL